MHCIIWQKGENKVRVDIYEPFKLDIFVLNTVVYSKKTKQKGLRLIQKFQTYYVCYVCS